MSVQLIDQKYDDNDPRCKRNEMRTIAAPADQTAMSRTESIPTGALIARVKVSVRGAMVSAELREHLFDRDMVAVLVFRGRVADDIALTRREVRNMVDRGVIVVGS